MALRRPVLSSSMKEASGAPRTRPLCDTMGIVSNAMKGIGEGERWNGRTQSGASWSPEQLGRELRLQVEAVTIEDPTDGNLPVCPEIPIHAESSVRAREHSGSRSG